MIKFNQIPNWNSLQDNITRLIHEFEKKTIYIDSPFFMSVITDSSFFPGFNKLIYKMNVQFEFSWDYHPSVTERMLQAVSSDQGKITEKQLLKRKSDPIIPSGITLNYCKEVIRSVFSEQYSREILDESGSFELQLSEKRQSEGKIKGPDDRESAILRFEESINDYTVLLAVNPVDYSMKLLFGNNENYTYSNPLNTFYHDYYNIIRFNKEQMIHDFSFFEYPGYRNYPDNLKNVNTFKTVFDLNRYSGDPLKDLIRSGRSQMSFLNQLLPYLIIFCGADTDGHHLIDPNGELVKEKYDSVSGILKMYLISRLFWTAHHDIVVNGSIKKFQDEKTREQLIFVSLNAAVFPFAEERPKSTYHLLHPLVYDAGK